MCLDFGGFRYDVVELLFRPMAYRSLKMKVIHTAQYNSQSQQRMEEHNYQFDSRVLASYGRWWKDIRGNKALAELPIPGDEFGETEERWIPIKFEVCPTCEGKGTHVDPNIDAGGLSQEDFDEDPDFAESYRSGMYNQECNGCNGQRVVPIPANEEDAKAVADMVEGSMETARAHAAERAMGA
jgi:hypothetical protein